MASIRRAATPSRSGRDALTAVELYEVGGGYVGRLRWERTQGASFKLSRPLTIEAVRDRWSQINDFNVPFPSDTVVTLTPTRKTSLGGDVAYRHLLLVEPSAAAVAAPEPVAVPPALPVIVLDAGHGGVDPGFQHRFGFFLLAQ